MGLLNFFKRKKDMSEPSNTVSCMLPIPTHLEDILIPIGNKNNEFHVDGVIRCSCGCENFNIRIFADTKNGYPQECEYNGGFALVVVVACADCKKEHLILDISIHGWDGFVCHRGTTAPDEELKSWNCPKCKNDIHSVYVSIESEGKQDFIEGAGIADGESEFKEDDWINAFCWITIGLKCSGCGKNDYIWIDYEAA